jgi:hypothetical protein
MDRLESVPRVGDGARVLDWTVPREWNVHEAWIADASGRRVVDFADHTLYLRVYSAPFRGRMPLADRSSPVLAAGAARPDPVPKPPTTRHDGASAFAIAISKRSRMANTTSASTRRSPMATSLTASTGVTCSDWWQTSRPAPSATLDDVLVGVSLGEPDD